MNSEWYFKLRVVFQTQIPISLVTFIISMQHLYMTKYKYTIHVYEISCYRRSEHSSPSNSCPHSRGCALYSEKAQERYFIFNRGALIFNTQLLGTSLFTEMAFENITALENKENMPITFAELPQKSPLLGHQPLSQSQRKQLTCEL